MSDSMLSDLFIWLSFYPMLSISQSTTSGEAEEQPICPWLRTNLSGTALGVPRKCKASCKRLSPGRGFGCMSLRSPSASWSHTRKLCLVFVEVSWGVLCPCSCSAESFWMNKLWGVVTGPWSNSISCHTRRIPTFPLPVSSS